MLGQFPGEITVVHLESMHEGERPTAIRGSEHRESLQMRATTDTRAPMRPLVA